MIREAMQYLFEKVAKPEVMTIGGKLYTTMAVIPAKDAEPIAICAGTLTGLVDYISANPDNLDAKSLFLNVTGHDVVTIQGPIHGDFNQRFVFLQAKLPSEISYPWGSFQEIEQFIIGLQSRFIQDDTTQSILQFVGNVRDEKVNTSQDDGISQTVTAKVGIARVAEAVVPNPVELRPFRTFPEIEQPKSKFVFRMRSGEPFELLRPFRTFPEIEQPKSKVFRIRSGEPVPICALFEADGGRWKVDAIASIREYLKTALPSVTIVA